jgi:hypothetical protein
MGVMSQFRGVNLINFYEELVVGFLFLVMFQSVTSHFQTIKICLLALRLIKHVKNIKDSIYVIRENS